MWLVKVGRIMRIWDPQRLASPAGIACSCAPAAVGDAGSALVAGSYALAAVAFAALAAALLWGARRRPPALLFALAGAATAGWLGTAAAQVWRHGAPGAAALALEAASGVAWLVFVGGLLWPVSFGRRRTLLKPAAALFAVAAGAVILTCALGVVGVSETPFIAFRLLTVVATAVALENLIRNTAAGDRRSLKFLGIGLGGVLGYDLFLYADGLLFGTFSHALIAARGVIYALVVPLLFVATMRRGMWRAQLRVSHQAAFHGAALVAIGGYLAAMALAASDIARMGGTRGPVIQAIFLFAALIFLLLIVVSERARAFLRVTIAKHLYRYKYDYREEWLRFTRRLAATESGAPIARRITEAIAAILGSPGGALWLREGERYVPASAVFTPAVGLTVREGEPMLRFLGEKGWIIDLDELRDSPGRYGGLATPPALQSLPRAWIVVPLSHRGALLAFVALLRPHTPRRLDWEDFDFLKLIGVHAGGFLAEHRAMQALAQAQEFERFNRRTAFIIHDIKNIVSELSLFAGNIRKHGDNPRFRADLADAIDGAVGRSRRLIERLRDDGDGGAANPPVPLKPLIGAVMQGFPEGAVALAVEDGGRDISVVGDEDRLRALFGHILRNALDAAGNRGGVALTLRASGGRATVDVADSGPGMDAEFVLNQLFKPFRSTKSDGLGIGAYQCREYARELGGDIEVVSSPGSGTTMRIVLPLAGAATRSARIA